MTVGHQSPPPRAPSGVQSPWMHRECSYVPHRCCQWTHRHVGGFSSNKFLIVVCEIWQLVETTDQRSEVRGQPYSPYHSCKPWTQPDGEFRCRCPVRSSVVWRKNNLSLEKTSTWSSGPAAGPAVVQMFTLVLVQKWDNMMSSSFSLSSNLNQSISWSVWIISSLSMKTTGLQELGCRGFTVSDRQPYWIVAWRGSSVQPISSSRPDSVNHLISVFRQLKLKLKLCALDRLEQKTAPIQPFGWLLSSSIFLLRCWTVHCYLLWRGSSCFWCSNQDKIIKASVLSISDWCTVLSA